MSLDHYHALRNAADPGTHAYLVANFNPLFAEAIERFTLFGWTAIGGSVTAALIAFGCWFRLRRRLPRSWLWLLPLLAFTPYAFIKGAVVFELMRQGPELPQMWELYFRYWMPLKMVRTPTLGLVFSAAAMVAMVWYRARRAGRS